MYDLSFRAINTIILPVSSFPRMDLQDQQQLVIEAQQSPEGFGRLYDYYFPKVYAFVACKVRNSDDAEDIASEVFMVVLQKIHAYEWRGIPITGWIFGIACNELKTHFERNVRVDPVQTDELEQLADDEDQTSPHKSAVRSELAREMRKVMKSLPEKELTVVQLKFFSQLTNLEIVEVTGLSATNVATILFRTLRKMKRGLTFFA